MPGAAQRNGSMSMYELQPPRWPTLLLREWFMKKSYDILRLRQGDGGDRTAHMRQAGW